MKTIKYIVFAHFICISLLLNAQTGLQNNGAKIIVQQGSTIRVAGSGGDITNASAGLEQGRIDLEGVIRLTGNFTNTASNSVFINPNADGEVQFISTTTQRILGTSKIEFENIWVDNLNNLSIENSIGVWNELFVRNGKLLCNNVEIKLENGSYLGGVNTSKYIVLNGTGKLTQWVANNLVAYPVGTLTNYSPIGINNAGTADFYSVGIFNSVTTDGTGTGTAITNIENTVKQSWTVDEEISGGSDLSITLQWKSDIEGNLFNRNNAGIGHYSGGSWKAGKATTAFGNNPYSLGITNVTEPGTFAVGDNNTILTDGIPPVLDLVQVHSNQSDVTFVKPGGTVNLLFRANENLKNTPTVSFLSGGKPISGSVTLVKNAENEYVAQFQPTVSDSEGTISFTINFADANGNAGISVNSTTDFSKVSFDKTLPKLSFVTIYSNAYDKTKAKIGTKLILEIEANEPLNAAPSVRIFSNLVEVQNSVIINQLSAFVYSAEVVLTDSDLEGTVSFRINYNDLSENEGAEVTQTTNSSMVSFDKTVPNVIASSMSSNNKRTHLAKPGDLVSIYFETDEQIQTPQVKIANTTVSPIRLGSSNRWQADYTMLSTDVEGLVSFEVSITDLVGNTGTLATEPISGNKVLFDKTPPTYANILVAASFRAQASYSIKINKLGVTTDMVYLAPLGTSSFEISNQISSTAGFSESIITPALEGRYYFFVADEAGNISPSSTSFIDVDATAPVINSISLTNGNYIPGNKLILKLFTDNSSESYIPANITVNGTVFPDLNLQFVEKSQTEYWLEYTISETDDKVTSGNLSVAISIKDLAGNVSLTQTTLPVNTVFIDTDRPSGSVRGNATICQGTTAPVFFELTGQSPWNLSYSNGTQTFVQNGITASPFKLDVSQTGAFSIVSLTDAEPAPGISLSGTATVTVNPLPNPSFNILSVYNIADDKVLLSGSPSGGVFSGAGIVESSSNFYPNIAEIGTHTITYTYTEPSSGCKNSVSKTVEVVGAGGSISGLKPLYCYTEPASTITGINPNSKIGTFTISGNKGLTNNGNNTATITPSQIGAGTFTVSYSYFDITNFVIERTFTVDSVGVVNFIGLSEKYCENSPLVTLSAIDLYPPNGTGTFTGPSSGFTNIAGGNSAIFDPTIVPANGLPIIISYVYKSPGGCLSAPIEKQTVVNVLPTVDFSMQSNYNFYGGSKVLTATPSGGIFQGSGIIESTFYPSVAGVNPNIPITYNYTNATTGCANSITKTTEVRIASGTINNLNAVYCYEDSPILITGNPENRSIVGVFSDSKNTITDNGDNTALINPIVMGAGKDTITYTYIIDGTTYSVFKEVFIDSIGNVNFIGLNDQYCAGDPMANLNAIYSHSSGSGNFASSISNFINYGNLAAFNPATANTSQTPFTVEYTYTSSYLNSGCKVKISKQTYIYPLPVTNFDLKDVYNVSQGAQPLNPAPSGGFFTGSGISGINFYPALAGIGSNFQVSYTYTDASTGCTSILKKLTNVLEAQASISGLNDKNIYCYGEPKDTIVGLSSNGLPGGTFSGKGVANIGSDKATFNATEAGAGTHSITYEYIGLDAVTNFSVTTTVIVDSIGAIDFVGLNPEMAYCTGSPAVVLAGFPSGGVFSGTGISGYQFLPTNENIGINKITYLYTNQYTGCKATVEKNVTVNNLPQLDFGIPDKFCNNAAPIYIKGAPVGGSFKFLNSEIKADSVLFDPNIATPGTVNISYEYTELTTGCSNKISKQTLIQAIGNAGISSNLASAVCENSSAVTIFGTINGEQVNSGNFIGFGITDPVLNDGFGIFNPQNATGSGEIKFMFTDANNCTLQAVKTITINKLTEISFSGYETNYCKNDASAALIGLPSGGIYTIGSVSGSGLNTFVPSNYLGKIPIKYQFTDANTCVSILTDTIEVFNIPSVDFSFSNSCSRDSAIFINKTSPKNEITDWLWNFGDPADIDNNESSLENPKHFYSIDGNRLVSLKATSIYGCIVNTSKTIPLGIKPKADFTWNNECFGESPSNFLNHSLGNGELTYNWSFSTLGVSTVRNPSFNFPEAKTYPVSLRITDFSGCTDTISKLVSIRPFVRNYPYVEDFESGTNGWVAESENSTNSWEYGTPAGNTINTANSGTKAWVTGLTVGYSNNEKSSVSGPCFDFTGLKRPMLKFAYFSKSQTGFDGAVVQTSVNGAPWTVLGAVGDVVNWYNDFSIEGNPGGQAQGWTGNTAQWTEARRKLDNLLLGNTSNIRFRIAFGSDANINDEGFAFDDIWIGERVGNSIIENFANTNSAASLAANTHLFDFMNTNALDAVLLQYHTAFPNADLYNKSYPTGAAARAVLYGVSEVPSVVLNGNAYSGTITGLALNKNVFDTEVLKDHPYHITVNAEVLDNNLKVMVEVEKNTTEPSTFDKVFVAVADKSVTFSAATNTYNFSNVVRTILPSSIGITLEPSMQKGDKKQYEFTAPLNSFTHSNTLNIISFVQNSNTKTICSANKITDISVITSVSELNKLGNCKLYPNPANNFAIIEFEQPNLETLEIQIHDISGRLQNVQTVEAGSAVYQIKTDHLLNGMYLLSVKRKAETIYIEKLTIMR